MTTKRSNLAERMITVAIWVPILVLVVFGFTWGRHLFLNLLLIFFSIFCGQELSNILKTKDLKISLFLYPLLSTIFPALALLTLYFPQLHNYLLPIIALTLTVIMARQTFIIDEEELNSAISHITGVVFALFYPGFFISYLIKLPTLTNSSFIYVFFLLLVMLNDTLAYLIGVAFGKITNTKGFVLVSPNKSLVGFMGGLLASIGVALFFYHFEATAPLFHKRDIWYAVIMGFFCGLASIVGDLFESTLKRSAGVKDSGAFFRGRGGVLDSFDSVAFAAPIFYYFLYFA